MNEPAQRVTWWDGGKNLNNYFPVNRNRHLVCLKIHWQGFVLYFLRREVFCKCFHESSYTSSVMEVADDTLPLKIRLHVYLPP